MVEPLKPSITISSILVIVMWMCLTLRCNTLMWFEVTNFFVFFCVEAYDKIKEPKEKGSKKYKGSGKKAKNQLKKKKKTL
jgi:hypothetical protein